MLCGDLKCRGGTGVEAAQQEGRRVEVLLWHGESGGEEGGG